MLVTERNVAACLERVERADDLLLDTETTGLKIWSEDRMVGVAIGAGGQKMYFPFRHGEGENLSEERRRQLISAASGKPLGGGFHLRFDCEVMHNEGLPLPPKIKDTMIAAMLMNENEPTFALKRNKRGEPGLSVKYLGADAVRADDALHEKLQSAGLTKNDMWKLAAADVAEYACDDLDLPERLMNEVYTPALRRWGQETIFAEYNDYQRLLISMEIGGLPVDRSVVDRALVEGEASRSALLKEIQHAAGYPLNPQSWKQVAAWLGTPNAQEATIMASNHPFADRLIDYKAYGKRDGTYLNRFIDYADSRGVLHVSLNLTRDEQDLGGTRSGRLSCSKPNLQAMPKPKTNIIYSACRQAIVAPPGFTLLEADWSQAEVRVAGHYSQEPALFDLFESGADPYVDLVNDLRVLLPNFERQGGKILHLAIQYGAGVWKVAEMLGVTKEEATQCRNGWNARFPRIRKMMYRMQDIAEENHCIKLFTGRYGHFDGDKKSAYCKSPYYTAWNRLIQGTVAEMARLAGMRMWHPLTDLGGRLMLQVHDSFVALIPTNKLRPAVEIIRHSMEDFPQWDIPPKIDIKVGPNWLDVEPYQEAA